MALRYVPMAAFVCLVVACHQQPAGDTGECPSVPGATVPISYVIGTANDDFGEFPFPPWDVVDPGTGANVGLDGQFVNAICDANARMDCSLTPVPYSDCGTGDTFVMGAALSDGTIDACSAWAQTPRRLQAGATFGPAVQSARYAVMATLIRDADAPTLPDTDAALNDLGANSIGYQVGFAAEIGCLQNQYPESTDLQDKVVGFTDESALFTAVAGGDPPYAWVLVTDTNFPPDGTALAHDAGALKNGGYPCGGPYALMLNEESGQRRDMSSLLRLDANCGAALVAAHSELEANIDFTQDGASNSAVSNTDFQDIACGQAVPTQTDTGIEDEDQRTLCALDSEIPPPTLACLQANGIGN